MLHPHFNEFTSVVPTLGLGISDFIIIFVGILIVHGVEFFEERGTDVQAWLNERPALMQPNRPATVPLSSNVHIKPA